MTSQQRSQQLLAIARRGGRRLPYALQIGAEREQAPIFSAERSRSFTFAPGELGFGLLKLAQVLLPLREKPQQRDEGGERTHLMGALLMADWGRATACGS